MWTAHNLIDNIKDQYHMNLRESDGKLTVEAQLTDLLEYKKKAEWCRQHC